MKRIIASGLALLLVMGMVGCTKEPEKDTSKNKSTKTSSSQLEIIKPDDDIPKQDIPSDEVITEDLRSALAIENQYAEITQIEMIKSLSEEGKYSASFTVRAATKYADWTYEADMKYTKYDQGWIVDSVNWKNGDSTISRLPNEQEMVEIVNRSLINLDYDLQTITYDEFVIDSFIETGMIRFSWVSNFTYKHASGAVGYYANWAYDYSSDDWLIVKDESTDSGLGLYETGKWWSTVHSNFDGIWEDITISNFCQDYVDVTWGDNYGHFVHVTSATSSYVKYDSIGMKWYEDGNGNLLCFHFTESKTTILISRRSGSTLNISRTVEISETLPTI